MTVFSGSQIPNAFCNQSAMKMVIIPATTSPFEMGSNAGIYNDESPVHKVNISRPFQMSEKPVTNGQFDALIGRLSVNRFAITAPDPRNGYHHVVVVGDENVKGLKENNLFNLLGQKLNITVDQKQRDTITEFGGFKTFALERERCGREFEGVNNPVVGVTWYLAAAWAELMGLSLGENWRLPTEAEWEYAARGREGKDYGDDTDKWLSASTAHYRYDNTIRATLEVGRKDPNTFGLYDMIGNVWEWAADIYGRYPPDEVIDPRGPVKGDARVLRGGSWCSNDPGGLRAAGRDGGHPGDRDGDVGFRCVASPQDSKK